MAISRPLQTSRHGRDDLQSLQHSFSPILGLWWIFLLLHSYTLGRIMRLLVTLPVLFRYRLRLDDDIGSGRLTYPSDGVSCLLVAGLKLLALRSRCRASACSKA